MLTKIISLLCNCAVGMNKESACIDMANLVLEKESEARKKNRLKDLKKYRVKISMIRPYETVDFWINKPDENNALELFMHELLFSDLSKYFKIEISKS